MVDKPNFLKFDYCIVSILESFYEKLLQYDRSILSSKGLKL